MRLVDWLAWEYGVLDRIDALTLAESASVLCRFGEMAVRVDVTVALLELPFVPFCATFTFEEEAVDVDPRDSAP